MLSYLFLTGGEENILVLQEVALSLNLTFPNSLNDIVKLVYFNNLYNKYYYFLKINNFYTIRILRMLTKTCYINRAFSPEETG